MSYAFKISIIIPVAPWEKSLAELEQQLAKIDNSQMDFEVILAHAHGSATCHMNFFIPKVPVTHIEALPPSTDSHALGTDIQINSRAHLMNMAAAQAQGEFVWFLHLDSCLTKASFPALKLAIKVYPKALLYFNLAFFDGSPWLMRMNQWGVYFRSHVLNMPFGDQGLCLHRDTFNHLGGYTIACAYGEDHLLVWQALHAQVELHCIDAYLLTSARKYSQQGWFKTTGNHLRLWLQQAWPQYKKLRHLRQQARN